jgi:hypothetical protein
MPLTNGEYLLQLANGVMDMFAMSALALFLRVGLGLITSLQDVKEALTCAITL